MNILVTGAGGFVGSRIMDYLPDATACPSLRNADREAVTRMVEEAAPEVILHTAAISDTGACERDPEASLLANVLVPEWLARASGGAKLVFFSSDQVYTGCAEPGPYREDIPLAPANVYGRHKLEMEQRVLAIDPCAVLLRATWMFDMPQYGAKNRGNYFVNTLRALLSGKPITASAQQHRGLTYVREVAKQMVPAMHLPGGVYNFGSENPLDGIETARVLLEALGADPAVRPLDGPAGHPLWMDCTKLRANGGGFSTTAEGLRRCCADYGLSL